jgi:hypothetical protein
MILKYAIGIGIGLVAGFLYYRFIGCTSGGCPITSSLPGSLAYGGLLGAAVTGFFK